MQSITLPDDHSQAITILLEKLTLAVPNSFGQSKLKSVIHIGAHKGEEVPFYEKFGFGEIFLVEANPPLAEKLSARFQQSKMVKVINQAVSDKVGTTKFFVHRTEKGSVESASLLPLKKLGEIVPVFASNECIQVSTNTLDNIFRNTEFQSESILLCLDIQGAELLALKGAKELLSDVKAIICEVNLIENYDGCPLEYEIEQRLLEAGFCRFFTIYHELYDKNGTFPAWGEGLWIKSKCI